MHGSHSSIALFSLAALAAALAPAKAHASPGSSRGPRLAHHAPDAICAKAPVEVTAGAESATFSLAKCDGGALGAGVDQLSILARPGSAPRPTEPLATLQKAHGPELAPGIRRVDPRLVERLQLAVDHFTADGPSDPAHVVLVSGIRPRNTGSYHSAGRALDFRIEGVKNDALAAFCKTLPDTGCGYYPNDVFIHMDVREPGTGHVAWVDTSRTSDSAGRVANDVSAKSAANAVARRDVTEGIAHERPSRSDPVAERDPVESAPALSMARPVAASEDADRRGAREDGAPDATTLARLPALPKADGVAPHRAKHKHRRGKGVDERHAL